MSIADEIDSVNVEAILRSVQLADDAVACAGALAHPDPDDAWDCVVTAREHLSRVLSALNGLIARPVTGMIISDSLPSTEEDRSVKPSQPLQLGRLCEEADWFQYGFEGKTQYMPEPTLDRAAELCKTAVEESVFAHDSAAQSDVREAAWRSMLASMAALDALLSIGARLPDGIAPSPSLDEATR